MFSDTPQEQHICLRAADNNVAASPEAMSRRNDVESDINGKRQTSKIAASRRDFRRLLKGRDRYEPRSFDNECDFRMSLGTVGVRGTSFRTVSDGLTGIARLVT